MAPLPTKWFIDIGQPIHLDSYDARAATQRLVDALLEVGNVSQLAGEPDLTDRHSTLREHAVVERARNCKRDREIRGRLCDLEAAERLDEHILVGKAKPAMLLEHGNEHRQS